MAANPAKMQRGFHDLTRAIAEQIPALRTVQGNLAYASDLIKYSRKKGHK